MRDDRATPRRAVLGGLAGLLLTRPAAAQLPEPLQDPPDLRTARSQFILLPAAAPLPHIGLDRLDGKRIALSSLRGRTVLLCFWATWCPPCRTELPQLERVQEMMRSEGVSVVAVSRDRAGAAAVRPFLDRLGVRRLMPFLDPEGRLTEPARPDAKPLFRLYGMPISYIIDRHGRAVGYFSGEMDWTSPPAVQLLRYFAQD